jgi:hypothetical protein
MLFLQISNVDLISFLLQALYNIAIHPDAYGKPYMWSSHEVRRLDALFSCKLFFFAYYNNNI